MESYYVLILFEDVASLSSASVFSITKLKAFTPGFVSTLIECEVPYFWCFGYRILLHGSESIFMFINSYSLAVLQESNSVILSVFESPQAFELLSTADLKYFYSFFSKYWLGEWCYAFDNI
jgi:hypothetical protein